MKRWMLMTAASALMLSGCFLLPVERQVEKPAPVVFPARTEKIEPVTRGNVIYKLPLGGVIRAAREEAIPFLLGGRIRRVPVQAGDEVKAGDVLVELEDDDARLKLSQAEIALQRAQIQLQIFDLDSRSPAGPDARRLQRELLLLTVRSAELEAERARQAAEAARIRAPWDGVVTSVTAANPGQAVGAGALAATVADPSRLVVGLEGVTEGQLRWLLEDQTAVVTLAGQSGTAKVEATVIQVPKAGVGPASRAVTVSYDLPAHIKPPRLGAPVEVVVEVAVEEETLMIPVGALRTDGRRQYAVVVDQAARREVTVEAGISDGLVVAIKSGLQEGDQVLVR